ncbi:hypothetical protein K443DRAFT_8140 [Laccaria amethystina LaAM-08-1]|uniref:Uncharacterized protein n=1 Tax=Laccaria amethystina LaAM-08-1 TaxID=1095629 RepID=A0A0C9XQ76_9AGAR|nr:hypothetical protein K443DRAFT_8140 [Laccaria amethystina LaAM-08-1]
MKSTPTNQKIHNQSSKFDIDVLEEASYVLWYIWRDKYARYATLASCIEALAGDGVLYEALKAARRRRRYEVIRNWKDAEQDASASRDAEVQKDIQNFLEELQPTMTKLVRGDISLPVWSPDDSMDPEIAEHLRSLHIPCLKGKPNLLLHDLGSFQDDESLQKRLKNIFMPNNHTFLVNTSGSGKTRLLLEGLCTHWGFYFTSLVDSSLLGSSDVQNTIETHLPHTAHFKVNLPPPGSSGYQAALDTNREIAGRLFKRVFLARLILFGAFAETMTRCLDHAAAHDHMEGEEGDKMRVYKQRWLLLQLQPSFVHPQVWDVFHALSCKLSNASDSYVNVRTKDLLTRVRTLCSRFPSFNTNPASGARTLSTSDTAQTPLFCILDEAQHAATHHTTSFRSDHSAAHRPILREIVRAWESQSVGHGVFMVVAGTGISKDVVDQAMASAIMKDSRYRWCSDTGAFDEVELQRRYLVKYLPKSVLDTAAGRRLVERVWYWLHGRHRFTAGFVAELIVNGFRRCHGLLNAYVEHFTHFNVTDAQSFVEAEKGSDALPNLSQYKLDFSKLKKNSDMLTTIHQLTTHYLMRSVLPVTLGKDEATYVEYGFARFVDPETKTVAVDEPLVLLAATHWINANHRTSYKFFAKQIHLHEPTSNGFENYIAFCIDMIFSQRRRINEVFSFVGTPPPWSDLEAELVALHRTTIGLGTVEQGSVRHFAFSGPSLALGMNVKTPAETTAWLNHCSHSPFCFPVDSMGPDLIFVLRLADGSTIWVALQAKFSSGKNGSLSRPFLRRAMRSVTPSNFFFDKEGNRYSPTSHPGLVEETRSHLKALPHRRRSDAGKYSLLRVVASFPADTNLKRCLEEDPDEEGHPIASLNMTLVKQLTRKLSPVDFLEGLEDPLRCGGKRKRGGEVPKRRSKKIKLN